MFEFWTEQTTPLAFAMVAALVALIVLPMNIKFIDEQLGYFCLLIGGAMLWLACRLETVVFVHGEFVQRLMAAPREELHTMLLDPWLLILSYLTLSLLSIVFRKRIEREVRAWTRVLPAHVLIGLWTLVIGSLGSLSVVVMATVGSIFFRTLQQVKRRDYTPSVVAYAAAIGISALLTTVGEPLSLFIARNLGEGTPYLLRTFGGVCAINAVFLALVAAWLARGAGPLAAPEAAEERQNLRQEVDGLLHSTAKVLFFVWGLLFFGEAVKPIAAHLFEDMHPFVAFFGNSVSAVADNALLGLLEIRHHTQQEDVMILGLSLAFWGVGLVPGNICNIVLKEKLGISFGMWARYGMPLACALAVLNFTLVLLGAGYWLTF